MYIDTFLTVIILVVIGLFFVLRSFFLWYWKINDIIKTQNQTNNLLWQLVNIQTTGKPYGDAQGKMVIKNTLTGELHILSREKWEHLIKKNPKQTLYKIIKENE